MAQIEMRISTGKGSAKGTRETTDLPQDVSDAAQALFGQLAQELEAQQAFAAPAEEAK